MPYLFYFWMFATMANLGLPGLSGFVGEMTIYYGSYLSPLTTMPGPEGLAKASVIFATLGAVLTASYMLWLLRRLFYGEELPKWKGHLNDARPTEKIIAYALCVSIFVLGIFPMILVGQFDSISKSMVNIIQTKLSS
jgi:NAD(P)H-quinone oxidoreductase subunit 4